jgi:hypothetical protein
MIDTAIKFLKDELNTYFLTQTGSDSVVEMGKLVDEAGKYPQEIQNKICTSIINIEEERIFKSQIPEHIYANGQHIVLEPELKINLHVIFAANFDFKLYDQSLRYLSYVLTYFQSHPSFTSEVYPALDSRIEKLTVELQSLNYEQLNQIWAFIGGKQLPSVVYKIRLVSLQDITPTAIQPPVTKIDTSLNAK